MVKNKTFDLVLSALGASLVAVCSWLTIPGTVPFTLQTFAVYCVLCLFGAKIGLQAIAVYILIGAVGAPVFAGFSSGVGVLFGTTGGFIFGFLFIGIIYELFTKFINDKLLTNIISLIIGTIFCYALGTAWFIFVYARSNGPIGLTAALMWCVVPFVIPDMIKMFMAVFISKRLKPLLLEHSVTKQ